MDEYDVDEDILRTGGIKGMRLADARIRKAGGFDAYFSKILQKTEDKSKRKGRRPKTVDYQNDLGRLESIAELALRPFSPLGTGEVIQAGEYRKRLFDLMHTGYPIPKGFAKLGKTGLHSLYTEVRQKMKDQVELYPEIKARIEAQHKRLQSPYSQ